MVLICLWIRRCLWQSLILFFFLIACSGRKDKINTISILWENERAAGISVPHSYFSEVSNDSIKSLLHVHLLKDDDQPAILGEYDIVDEAVVFKPLIPFTPGLTYEVRLAGRSIVKIEIPVTDHKDRPALTAIYPMQDTVPHNLLKVYLQFSRPMREGQSLQHIAVLKNGSDTVPEVFLDLQPELWNHDRTMLTLWLDPGRIKRDLQPNQRLGEPLENGATYRLMIFGDWKDTQGTSLPQDYQKDFFVTSRDSLSPDPEHWTIRVPEAGTKKPVAIDFHETLDRVLLREAIHITDAEGNALTGAVELNDEETSYLFTPEVPWSKGTYLVQCEARIEDLAGNNLNRPFDRDLTVNTVSVSKEVFSRKFQIN